MPISKTILRNLIHDEDYARKSLPFLKDLYFEDPSERAIFLSINEFIVKYNTLPSIEALQIAIAQQKITESQIGNIAEILNSLKVREEKDISEWLIDETEKFCQERAIDIALYEAIEISNGESKTKDKGSIPKILADALAVSFDPHVGHNYIEDSEKRFEFYHTVEKRVPFDLKYFNTITNGGLPLKTLNIIMGGIGVGKTLAMCHMAAGAMSMGFDVLYITLEMSEERIAERIDANLLDVELDLLKDLPKDVYMKRISRIREKTVGKLIIKEYPTASAHVGHFRHLLNELFLKKNFKPKIIYVDYINICASSRMKMGGSVNTYSFIKSVAEELRGLAVEFGVPIVSGTQLTRSGFTNSDPGMEDTAESFGLPATADFVVVIVQDESLEQLGQMMVKQIKNRYRDKAKNRKFIIGVDKPKMRMFDVDPAAQNLVDGELDMTEPNKKRFDKKEKFKGFKFGE